MSSNPETTPVVDSKVAHRYLEWLAKESRAPHFDAYYSEPRARFHCTPEDVLMTPEDVQARPASCGVHIASQGAAAGLDVCGVRPADAERLLGAIDGVRTADAVRRESGVDEETWETFMNAVFGSVVFAPHAVMGLERRLRNSEIVRFPGSPYEVVREYWSNMADVGARLDDPTRGLGRGLDSADHFARFLRELHVLALVGESGESFYRPASPIAAKERLLPGHFADLPPVTEPRPEGLRFVSGLRVNATAIGGPYYGALLGESVEKARASDPSADFGLHWGGIFACRADADEAPAPWFCPPRPLTATHFEALRTHLVAALAAARRGKSERALAAAGAFHWGFVRLHPFGFANQSLAMMLANRVLRELSGAGIPHLVLDHLALGLPVDSYTALFARASAEWSLPGIDAVQRTLALLRKKQHCFAFMTALGEASSLDAARLLLSTDPEGARLAHL